MVLYRSFFWISGLLLLFVLNAAVIAAFERDFTAQHRAHCYKLRLQRRLGILAAFIVLDKDQSGDLALAEVLLRRRLSPRPAPTPPFALTRLLPVQFSPFSPHPYSQERLSAPSPSHSPPSSRPSLSRPRP